jgi:RNA polymerase sigma-70 factor, ECF subfamily
VPALPAAASPTDAESRAWLRKLRGGGRTAEEAGTRLHALLLRTARFEVARRRPELPLPPDEAAEIAVEAAHDALLNVRAHLDDFQGADRRFTTWAAKFAVLETAVRMRRRAWEERELLEPNTWIAYPGPVPAEENELLSALQAASAELLTPTQRRVLAALALNGVPIDVLAQRLNTTRGELYETLRGARRTLRQRLAPAVLS